jgi:hypothetical protein
MIVNWNFPHPSRFFDARSPIVRMVVLIDLCIHPLQFTCASSSGMAEGAVQAVIASASACMTKSLRIKVKNDNGS